MTAEQEARDLLERLGIDDAQEYSAGDLVELANLIAESRPDLRMRLDAAERTLEHIRATALPEMDAMRGELLKLRNANHRLEDDNRRMSEDLATRPIRLHTWEFWAGAASGLLLFFALRGMFS